MESFRQHIGHQALQRFNDQEIDNCEQSAHVLKDRVTRAKDQARVHYSNAQNLVHVQHVITDLLKVTSRTNSSNSNSHRKTMS